MTPLPQVEVSSVGDVVVVRLAGEIDSANVAVIGAASIRAISNDATGLIVDLSSVRYLDSSGIQMLFRLVRELDVRRQGLGLLLGTASPVRRLIKVTGLDNVATCCESVEECASALRAQAEERY